MESNIRKPGGGKFSLEVTNEVARLDRRADARRKDEAAFAPRGARREPVLKLTDTMRPERFQRDLGQRDCAPAAFGFGLGGGKKARFRAGDPRSDALDSLLHAKRARVEVDV